MLGLQQKMCSGILASHRDEDWGENYSHIYPQAHLSLSQREERGREDVGSTQLHPTSPGWAMLSSMGGPGVEGQVNLTVLAGGVCDSWSIP